MHVPVAGRVSGPHNEAFKFQPTMSHLESESTIGTVHEVQTLRQELAETRKKLQDYADTGMWLSYCMFWLLLNHHQNDSYISSW